MRLPSWLQPTWVAALIVALILGTHFVRHHDQVIDELDEAAVIYSTSYLDLFLEGRFDAPQWQAMDAVDHPPAWKYAHGAALKLAGRPARPLSEKDLWLDWAWRGQEEHENFKRYTRQDVPQADLFPARTLSFLSVLLAVLLFGWCAVRATSPWIGSLAMVFLGVHATVKWVSTRALIDGLLLCGIAVTTLLTVRWLERDPRRLRAALPASIGLGVALGVLAETKITGGMGGVAAAIALLAFLLHTRSAARGWLTALGSLAVVGAVAIGVAVAINPSLWRDPFGFLGQMIDHRALQLRLQMLFSHRDGAVPVLEGIRRFVFRSMLWPDPIYRAIGVPAVAFGVVLGALHLLRTEGRSPARIAVLAQLGVWALVTLGTYRMDWPRYMLPALPLFTLLAATALVLLVTTRGRVSWRRAVPAALVAVALTALAHVDTLRHGEERRAQLESTLEFLDAEAARTSSTSHKWQALKLRRELFERRLADPSKDPVK